MAQDREGVAGPARARETGSSTNLHTLNACENNGGAGKGIVVGGWQSKKQSEPVSV